MSSLWPQFTQLVRQFFPNRYAQFFFYAGLVIAFVASPTRQDLVYFGVPTLPGFYFYGVGGACVLTGVVLARALPRRQFPSVAAAIRYWVEREGGLDYAAYYNDLARLSTAADPAAEPAEEVFHATQIESRTGRLSVRGVDVDALRDQWRALTAVVHRRVGELDLLFGGTVLGVNEKIVFDTAMGGLYYWRMSPREVLVGFTVDQASVDNHAADFEFTGIGDAIRDLTGRRRRDH